MASEYPDGTHSHAAVGRPVRGGVEAAPVAGQRVHTWAVSAATSSRPSRRGTVLGWTCVGVSSFVWLCAALAVSNSSRGEAVGIAGGYVIAPLSIFWVAGRARPRIRVAIRAVIASVSVVLVLVVLAASVV
jgi:hypothetical protein